MLVKVVAVLLNKVGKLMEIGKTILLEEKKRRKKEKRKKENHIHTIERIKFEIYGGVAYVVV